MCDLSGLYIFGYNLYKLIGKFHYFDRIFSIIRLFKIA
jgi:hypothetical protein